MKTKLIPALTLIAIWSTCPAAAEPAPDFLWAKQAGGSASDKMNCVAVGGGSYYGGGGFDSTVSFGSFTLTNAGGQDLFLVKYDTNGIVQWAKRFGGVANEIGNGIAADSTGNCHVVGEFTTTNFVLGSFTLTNQSGAGNNDIFVAKLNSSGDVLWAKRAGGIGAQSAANAALDGAGNCYVVGQTQDTNDFGGLVTIGGSMFVAKYSPAGVPLWAHTAGNGVEAHAVAVDGSGNCYVTGPYLGNARFEGVVMLPGNGMYVAKYASDGSLQWVRGVTNSIYVSADSVTVTSSGDCYVTGWFQYGATFGTNTINSFSSSYDPFIAKYDSAGNVLWVRQVGGTAADYGVDVDVDWEGSCYVAGHFSGTATFGTNQLTAQSRDPFLVKFDSAGNCRWVQQAGGSSLDESTTLALDAAGNIVWCGTFRSTANFGTNALVSAGTDDIFVTKLRSTTTAVPLTLSIAMYAGLTIYNTPGHNIQIEYVNDIQNTNNWLYLTNFILPTSPYLYIDVDSPTHPKRFYRAIESY